jgi:hypothetical protein
MFVSLRRAATVGVVAAFVGCFGAALHAQDPGFTDRWRSGTAVTVTGSLTTLIGDDFSTGRSSVHHVIRDERTGQSYQIHFDQDGQERLNGRRVVVRGRAHESDLYALAAQTTELTSSTTANLATMSASPSGDQRTLVIAADFRDAALPCTTGDLDAAMFSDPSGQSVDALYRSSSNGRVTFSGQVAGPFLLNANAADSCNLTGWADALDAQASATGVDVTAFPRRMYVLPATSCGAAGWGTVGGSPSRSWVLACGTRGVYPHEIGHNLGMDHASTPTSEYGDNTDPMSIASWMLHGVNAPHRHQLGWTAPETIRVVSESGLFEVSPLAGDPLVAVAPSMLLIRKPDTGDYYYVSYRTKVNGDQYIDGSYYSRLSIHRYSGDGSSTRTTLVAGLYDGESFVDSINGITVRQIAHDATRSVAQIDLTQTCVPQVPLVAATPVAQTGPAPATVAYQVTVTNTDSPACTARTFVVSEAVPTGWTASVSSSAPTLAPGQSTTVTATLGVPSTAAAASYVAEVVVGGGDISARTPMTYAVQPTGDTTPPAAPTRLTASVNSKRRQVQLSWLASSDNVGVVAYRISRNDVAIAEVASNGFTDTAWQAGAVNTYAIVARDAAGNLSPASNAVTVTMSSGTTSGGGGGGRKP